MKSVVTPNVPKTTRVTCSSETFKAHKNVTSDAVVISTMPKDTLAVATPSVGAEINLTENLPKMLKIQPDHANLVAVIGGLFFFFFFIRF